MINTNAIEPGWLIWSGCAVYRVREIRRDYLSGFVTYRLHSVGTTATGLTVETRYDPVTAAELRLLAIYAAPNMDTLRELMRSNAIEIVTLPSTLPLPESDNAATRGTIG